MTATPAFTARLLRASAGAYASATVARLEADAPATLAALPPTFARAREDLEVRLLHLAAAVEFDRPALLEDAVAWYRVALHHRGVGLDYLLAGLDAMAAVLAEQLPAEAAPLVQRHLAAARARAQSAPVELPTCLDKDAPHGLLACRFLLAMLEGRGDDAVALVRAALDAGLSLAELHDGVLEPVQRETGRMWLKAEIQIADEHYSSGVVERVLAMALERLPRPAADAPRVLVLGVAGDLHSFGVRMIGQRLLAEGLLVHDLGGNMPAEDLEGALFERPVDLVAVGATMTIHLHALRGLVAELRRLLGPRVPVVVGGAPFRLVPDLFALLGADAGAGDGAGAVAAVRRLLPRRGGA